MKHINDNVYIIAEAEINHNGCFSTAKKMIESAAECGADCIKFQYIIAEEIANKDSDSFLLFKDVELTSDDFFRLKQYAEKKCNIDFMITAPSVKSFDKIINLAIDKIKIGSSNIDNVLLLNHISSYINDIEVFLSSGASTLEEISVALRSLSADKSDKPITLFHCTSKYPAEYCDLNLNSIKTLASAYPNVRLGYSDHTTDSIAAIVSVALGVKVIEKHFTLDKKMKGPDHFFSMDIVEFKKYIKDIRNTEKSLGSDIKKPSSSEKGIVGSIRRYLVFRKKVTKGEKLKNTLFDTKRIDTNLYLSPIKAAEINIVNKLKSPKNFNIGDVLCWDSFNE